MSLKDWKNNELRTVLSERWGFSFNLLTESQEEEVVEEAAEEVEEGMADARHSGRSRKPKLQKDRRKDSKEEELDEVKHDDEELEEGAASSGRAATPDRGGEDRRSGDERKRPMEEAEKPDFPDVDGDGDREEPISKASKEKKGDKGDHKKEKSDKDMSKVPPQLRKHVKGKMDEQKIRRIIRKLVKEAMAKKAK